VLLVESAILNQSVRLGHLVAFHLIKRCTVDETEGK
jgi:hypothetical protein